VAQIVPVTSESLEAQIRNLLPSQRGFGEDLQASNVILPIIDLTPTAEGANLRQDLQTALDINVSNQNIAAGTTETLTTTPGFYQISFSAINSSGSLARSCLFRLSDGFSTKIVHYVNISPASTVNGVLPIIYVEPGNTLSCQNGSDVATNTAYRQIADNSGNLVNPQGFVQQ
jgi:hypothetical protein